MQETHRLICDSVKEKGIWISTYSTIGSTFVLFSLFYTILWISYFTGVKKKIPFALASQIGLFSAFLLTAIGACSSAICIRKDMDFEMLTAVLNGIPEAFSSLAFGLVFSSYLLFTTMHVDHPITGKVKKLLYVSLISLSTFFLGSIVVAALAYLGVIKSHNVINTWLSFTRDLVFAGLYFLTFKILRGYKNLELKSDNLESKIHLAALITTIAIAGRGLFYPIYQYSFNRNGNLSCGIPANICFLIIEILFHFIPFTTTLAVQGIVEKITTYDSF